MKNMNKVFIDSALDRETCGRDYIIDKAIENLNKTQECHGYIFIQEPKTDEEEETAIILFGDNLGKKIFYSWVNIEGEDQLFISSKLDQFDEVDIDFNIYECDTEIKIKSEII